MDRLIIGVWQGRCANGDLEANLRRAGEIIDEAGRAGCDFVCLPETFLSGYGTAEIVRNTALALDDERLVALAARAHQYGLVALVGLAEKRPNGDLANSEVVLSGGGVAGVYSKTMRTGGDVEMGFCEDNDQPVFKAKGITFGIIVCHDSSFPEVAATLVWKGAQVIFSPHFNALPDHRMDEHRRLVRNNHIGIAAHYNVVVARSNVIVTDEREGLTGYGDSAIFSPHGHPIAEAGLLTECLVTADVAPWLDKQGWRRRSQLRRAVIDRWYAAATAYLYANPDASR